MFTSHLAYLVLSPSSDRASSRDGDYKGLERRALQRPRIIGLPAQSHLLEGGRLPWSRMLRRELQEGVHP
jgi:hypothetical protein